MKLVKNDDEDLALDDVGTVTGPQTEKALVAVKRQRADDDEDEGYFRDYQDGVAGTMFAGPTLPADLREVQHANQGLKDARRLAKTTWRHFVAYDVARVFAAQDQHALRSRLVSLTAVLVAWIEALDRREDEARAAVASGLTLKRMPVRLPWWRRLTLRLRRVMVRP